MSDPSFSIEPRSFAIAETSVSAVICPDRADNRWDVTVILSRAPDLPPIQGRDVDAQLLDARGSPLHVLERPQGVLAEFGGGLGSSATSLFRFQDSGVLPAELLVSYQDQTARFRVVSTGTD